MAINEVIKNSAYRVWNELEGVWKKYALWTTGSQVECADGYTVEDKIGDIKGITTSTNVTETGYAADASTVSTISKDVTTLKSNFQDGCSTIAAAVTEMGVATASNASPDTIAANVKKIKSGLTLVETKNISRSTATTTMSATSISGYKNLTKDDFILVVNNVSAYGYDSPNNVTLTCSPIISSYTASSGTINISGLNKSQVDTTYDSHLYAYASKISVYVLN